MPHHARPAGTVVSGKPWRGPAVLAVLVGLCTTAATAADEPSRLRVETVVYDSQNDDTPVARSLTLFQNGMAWDFLERLSKEGEALTGEPAEIVLHDPARDRVILIDPARGVKTQVDTLRLERLRASLATWARSTDDPQLRWAGGPDFSPTTGGESSREITLEGPRVRYVVACEPAPGSRAAEDYRRFADTALLVKALVHPGGLPPYPRIAINQQVAESGAIPASVRLEIEPRLGRIAGRARVMRSEHRALSSWSAADHKRVAAAEERLSVAAGVDLAEYAAAPGSSTADVPADDRRR